MKSVLCLSAQDINGSWEFIAADGRRLCFAFNQGTITYYSAFCDGVNDLRGISSVTVTGDQVELSFAIVPTGIVAVQTNMTFAGTALDADTIEGRLTNALGGQALTLDGVLLRR